MSTEVKEKDEEVKQARIEIPANVHERVARHQARLIGRKGEKVTFAEACVDILDKATRKQK
jgi:hypothetical protein